jgi:hypothetical protein
LFINSPAYINRNLAPGGYIELADICFPVQADDKSLKSDSALRKWSNLMLEAAQKAGSPINSAQLYKAQLEATGFCNVVEIQYKWPQNRWPKDKTLKTLGMYIFCFIFCQPLLICEIKSKAFHLGLVVEFESRSS